MKAFFKDGTESQKDKNCKEVKNEVDRHQEIDGFGNQGWSDGKT